MANIVTTENFGGSFTAFPAAPVTPWTQARRPSPSRHSLAGDVRGIVARTVSSARATGRDYMGQSRAAAAAVMSVRPDLTFGEALDTVIRVREVESI